MMYGTFILELVLALHCYFGDKKQNTGFFQIIYFKGSKNMAVGKNLKITSNLKKNYALQLLFIQAGCANNIRTGEIFCSCYFQRFVSRIFSGRAKKCNLIWSVRVILGFSEMRNTACK